MERVILDLEQTTVTLETDEATLRQVLVLSDGKTEVGFNVPAASGEHPFPYMLISALGRHVEEGAIAARLEELRFHAYQHGPHTGPGRSR